MATPPPPAGPSSAVRCGSSWHVMPSQHSVKSLSALLSVTCWHPTQYIYMVQTTACYKEHSDSLSYCYVPPDLSKHFFCIPNVHYAIWSLPSTVMCGCCTESRHGPWGLYHSYLILYQNSTSYRVLSHLSVPPLLPLRQALCARMKISHEQVCFQVSKIPTGHSAACNDVCAPTKIGPIMFF